MTRASSLDSRIECGKSEKIETKKITEAFIHRLRKKFGAAGNFSKYRLCSYPYTTAFSNKQLSAILLTRSFSLAG